MCNNKYPWRGLYLYPFINHSFKVISSRVGWGRSRKISYGISAIGMNSPLIFFSQASVLIFECNVMLLMWTVSKPILLSARPSCANRELGFPRPAQMKESNHLKTHKRDVPRWDTPRRWTCATWSLFTLSACVLTLVMSTVFSCHGKSAPNWTLSRPECA